MLSEDWSSLPKRVVNSAATHNSMNITARYVVVRLRMSAVRRTPNTCAAPIPTPNALANPDPLLLCRRTTKINKIETIIVRLTTMICATCISFLLEFLRSEI